MKKILSLFLAITGIIILSTLILPSSSFSVHNAETETGTRTIPSIQDPTPGYWETSEYLIGSVAVGIIFLESNGTTDPETEDWTTNEESTVVSKIEYALDWWARQNLSANVSFVTDIHYRVPTSYEPINHPHDDGDLWNTEAMAYLGYTYPYRPRDYINDLRDTLGTDWCFAIFVVDASNDDDGCFTDGWYAFSYYGGPYLMVPFYPQLDTSWNVAHEMGHIFWATDEYDYNTNYRGYLNVPDVEGSGCLMETWNSWRLSGKPNGWKGTWGQVGWRDSDGDGIQNIVDTFPLIKLDEMPPETTNITLKYRGAATVVPYPTRSIVSKNPEGPQSVTINKIKSIEFRIDGGQWMSANASDGSFGDAVEEFEFVTPPLSLGEHFAEVIATNNWGNSGNANHKITILEGILGDINGDGVLDIFDVVEAATAFDSKTGDQNWNPAADLNNNNIVDIFDIVQLAQNFGKTA